MRERAIFLSAALSSLGGLPLLFFEGILGYDSSSHIAKTAFLMYSFSNGNYSGWSQFWYGGFQLVDTYPPLLYFTAALLGWPWGSAIVGMKLVVLISFALSGMALYALARDFGISSGWALGASLLYTFSPPHMLFMYDYGSLSYSLGFALSPIVLLALRRTIRRQTWFWSLISGISIALLLLANSPTVYVLIFPVACYVLLLSSKSNPKALMKHGLFLAVAAFCLAAFWLVPYTLYGSSGQLNLLWTPASETYPSEEIITLSSLLTPNFTALRAGYIGHVILLPALAALPFLRNREDAGLYLAGVVSILLTVGASISNLFYNIPLVLALQFPKRFLIADVLFLSILAALFFERAFKKARIFVNARAWPKPRALRLVGFPMLFLLIVLPFATQPELLDRSNFWRANFDLEEKQAYHYLAAQPGFFRVMARDRYHQWFPAFTMKGSVDGWYDQATALPYRNFTLDMYYANPIDVERTFNGLRLLGVRYVMTYFGYGEDGPSGFQIYNASPLAPPVFENSRIAIFEVPNTSLVYVAGSAIGISSRDPQALGPELGGIVKRADFDPEGLVVLNAQCGTTHPEIQCYDRNSTLPSKRIEYHISDLTWSENEVSFDLSVTQEAFVYLSLAYFPGWTATIDGSNTKILLTPIGFMTLIVNAAGLYHINLRYQMAEMKIVAIIISLGSWIAVVCSLLIRYRRPSRF